MISILRHKQRKDDEDRGSDELYRFQTTHQKLRELAPPPVVVYDYSQTLVTVSNVKYQAHKIQNYSTLYNCPLGLKKK